MIAGSAARNSGPTMSLMGLPAAKNTLIAARAASTMCPCGVISATTGESVLIPKAAAVAC